MDDPRNLTLGQLNDAIRTVTNAATIWYGTSDVIERGKVLVCEATEPPYVIVHPDEVGVLGSNARHLREYQPTQADIAAAFRRTIDDLKAQEIAYASDERVSWVFRRRYGLR